MLDSFVWPAVSGWDNIDNLIFMQDGAPPHFTFTVRAWLDQHFSGLWMGRRGPHEWPSSINSTTQHGQSLGQEFNQQHTQGLLLRHCRDGFQT